MYFNIVLFFDDFFECLCFSLASKWSSSAQYYYYYDVWFHIANYIFSISLDLLIFAPFYASLIIKNPANLKCLYNICLFVSEHSNNQLLDGMVRRSGILRSNPSLLSGRIRLHKADGQAAQTQFHPRLPSGWVSGILFLFGVVDKNFVVFFVQNSEKAGIAPLLDVEDMVVMRKPDWKCVFTYVQSIHRRFRNVE